MIFFKGSCAELSAATDDVVEGFANVSDILVEVSRIAIKKFFIVVPILLTKAEQLTTVWKDVCNRPEPDETPTLDTSSSSQRRKNKFRVNYFYLFGNYTVKILDARKILIQLGFNENIMFRLCNGATLKRANPVRTPPSAPLNARSGLSCRAVWLASADEGKHISNTTKQKSTLPKR